jgi:2-dehydro-3-deoxyphosphogluconate aldolase/(4S)-4-hydroxy-2-oxoglutarate aldolase
LRHDDVLSLLADARLIAILRGDFGDRLLDIVNALVDGGIRLLEISTVSTHYAEAIGEIVKVHGGRLAVGAGTVLNLVHLETVVDAGASFIVSPDLNKEVVEETRRQGCASFPGAFTPTEITSAIRYGADAVKLFPASALSPAFVRGLRGPLPDLKMIPTGGVNLDNIEEWFGAGAYAVAIGSELVNAAEAGAIDLKALSYKARQYSQAAMRQTHG